MTQKTPQGAQQQPSSLQQPASDSTPAPQFVISLERPPGPPGKLETFVKLFPSVGTVIGLVGAGIALLVSIRTLDSTVGKAQADAQIASAAAARANDEAKKLVAEVESAKASAYKARAENAGRPGVGNHAVNAIPLLEQKGSYLVTAALSFTNTGVESIVVEHVRFACGSLTLFPPSKKSGAVDVSVAPLPGWINTLVSPAGPSWTDLGDAVSYPLGLDPKTSGHRSNFDASGKFLPPGKRYQPNGVGVFMAGESLTASHSVLAKLASTSLVECTAEIDYHIDARTRTEILKAPLSETASPLRYPFVGQAGPLCGIDPSCK